MNIVAPYAVFLLAALFILSGLTKVFDRLRLRGALTELGIIPPVLTTTVSRILPIAEFAIGALLLAGTPMAVMAGALASLVLLALFIVVAILAIASGKTGVKCSCFGPLSESTFGYGLILRNVGLILLAVVVFVIPMLAAPGAYSLLRAERVATVILPIVALFPVYALTTHFSQLEYYSAYPPFSQDENTGPANGTEG